MPELGDVQNTGFLQLPGLDDKAGAPYGHPAPPMPPGSFLGRTISHYQVLERLGVGGMGVVYRARDLTLRRQVALKFLLPHQPHAPASKIRLIREAQAAAALDDPNIATVYEVAENEGQMFIAMALYDGETLKQRLARGPLDLDEVDSILQQFCSGLAAAHAAGIVHRDLKPANVMLTRAGRVKLLDFGLAKLMLKPEESNESLTAQGEILGTVAYMSPEQARGEDLDPRTDLWSLGVIAYEMLTGSRPFQGDSSVAILSRILTSEPKPIEDLRKGIPASVRSVVSGLLHKDRDARVPSVEEVVRLLGAGGVRAHAGALSEARGPGDAAPATLLQPVSTAEATGASAEGKLEAFVGREPELTRLEELLRQVLAGSGKTVLLAGDLGIGKTTLAGEFLRRMRSVPDVLMGTGRCIEQYGTGEAFLPFLEALGTLLSGSGRDGVISSLRNCAPTWCLQLPSAFGSSGTWQSLQQETIGATKERMLRELGDALEALSRTTPVVFLLEDVHWADRSSAELINYLGRRVGSQRVLLLLTLRPADLEAGDHLLKRILPELQAHNLCTALALGSLTEEHITAYLDARFAPNNFSRELAALIQKKAEGHPLFTTSLVAVPQRGRCHREDRRPIQLDASDFGAGPRGA